MKKLFLFCFAFVFAVAAFCKETSVKGLYAYELPNGLSLFVAENHSVPLTYIELAVRCGAYTQTPENTGLFHLFEHIIFKGNSLYKDASAVNRALSDIGVSGKNGSTDIDHVNYYCMVPAEQTKKALEFWNAAIRTPLFDKDEFEKEKKVVISEINGRKSTPSSIYWARRNEILFADAPYKLDSAGVEQTVQNATVKQMKDIQKTYYIPNNTALFVGGDVNADEVYSMVKKIFGSWKKGKNPFASGVFKQNPEPLFEPYFGVMPFDTLSSQLGQISLEFRGPDAFFDEQDTYTADILLMLLSDPDGFFKQTLASDGAIGIPDTDYVSASYPTRKASGVFSFYCTVVQPELDMPERAKYVASTIPLVLEKFVQSVTSEQIAAAALRLEDEAILARQTASGLLEGVRFWWCATSADYYFSYSQKMKQVTVQDLQNFVSKYFLGKNPLVSVLVNPAVYDMSQADYKNAGFVLMNKNQLEQE